MGEDCGSWFPQRLFDWQSPNLNYSSAPFPLGWHNSGPSFMNGIDMVSSNGTLPVYPFPTPPHSRAGQTSEPHGWFYCLPSFRQAFMPASNAVLKKKPSISSPLDIDREANVPRVGSGCAQKRFLVVDQSGNQTTLIFSSGIGTPVQCLASWSPKPPAAYVLNRGDPRTKENLNLRSAPISADEFGGHNGTAVQSEMHEDTEELNALLYSDDDSGYTEDDEVTSTGHSPSTMTAQDKQDWFEGSTEVVASPTGLTKKRKLSVGGDDDIPSLMDTASSVKPNRCVDYDDDAESSCANLNNPGLGEEGSLSGNKRNRREKIRETVDILQSIIPGAKGKEAIVVLDEAIQYLKSLKLKAKSLGLSAL